MVDTESSCNRGQTGSPPPWCGLGRGGGLCARCREHMQLSKVLLHALLPFFCSCHCKVTDSWVLLSVDASVNQALVRMEKKDWHLGKEIAGLGCTLFLRCMDEKEILLCKMDHWTICHFSSSDRKWFCMRKMYLCEHVNTRVHTHNSQVRDRGCTPIIEGTVLPVHYCWPASFVLLLKLHYSLSLVMLYIFKHC